ncbi:hypothetical protein MRX96_038484 [Rhipicephalus microplus]
MSARCGSGTFRLQRCAQIKDRRRKHQKQTFLATINSPRRRQLNRGTMQQMATLPQPYPRHYPKPCCALLDNENMYSDYIIKGREMSESDVSPIELIC